MSDNISRADAIEAVYKIMPIEYRVFATQTKQLCDRKEFVDALEALPSAELVLQTPQTYGKSINPSNAEVVEDLISRADVLEGLKHSTAYLHDDIYTIVNRIPSAETTGALDDAIAKYVADGYMLPPSGDLISRADAIEAFGLSEKTRKYGGDHSGYDTMLKYEIQDVLENLPSAEAEWIPCSERLPSEDGCYLVSTTGTNNDIIDIAYYTEEMIWHKASRIKAWMPLPKPYREDGKEYELATEQMEHDAMYEPTYISEDGSM